jgi:hypothetical protein
MISPLPRASDLSAPLGLEPRRLARVHEKLLRRRPITSEWRMDLSLEDSIAIHEDVLFRELDDEAVLLNLRTGVYFGLNPAGLRIWQLIGKGRSLEQVLETMRGEYEVDGQVLERDLLELCRQLCAQGLGEVVSS